MCWTGLLFARDSQPDGLRPKGGSHKRPLIDDLKNNLMIDRRGFWLAEWSCHDRWRAPDCMITGESDSGC